MSAKKGLELFFKCCHKYSVRKKQRVDYPTPTGPVELKCKIIFLYLHFEILGTALDVIFQTNKTSLLSCVIIY